MCAEFDTAREAVVGAARRVAASGLVIGSAGNLSMAVGELVAITASGAVLGTIEPDQIAIVDRAGEPLVRAPTPSSELALHLGIYERYGAGAVVHTHAPMATAVSCVLDELPCIHYQMLLLGGAIRVAPYRTFGSAELAEVTLAALQGRTAALMANHGAIAFADDIELAVQQALLLEWSCGVYWHADALGEPKVLSPAEQQAAIEAATARNYGTTLWGSPTTVASLRREPTQQRGRERVQRVLDAADRLIAADGAEALGTRQVAAEAGVSIGSVYFWFPDKESIAAALAGRYWADFAHLVAGVADAASDGTLDDPVGEVLQVLAAGFRTSPGFVALWFGGKLTQRIRAATRPFRNEVAASVERILAVVAPDAEPHMFPTVARTVLLLGDGILREAFLLEHRGDPLVLSEGARALRAYIIDRLTDAE
ncbi:MAG TPA: class II aldolase/adducin family protein [Solirubrobacteraceae bacterium]|jgi:L-fuculose-phosphate aldolase|nr:class II aldolase/adducin family protein [Solirubrobacteraceae bacterium]